MNTWTAIGNLGFALFFGGFTLICVREAVRAYWPVHKERMQAQTRKAEADAALAVATAQNQRDLVSLTDRNTQMNSANTQVLSVAANLLGEIHRNVKDVYKHLLSGCECDRDRSEEPKPELQGRTE